MLRALRPPKLSESCNYGTYPIWARLPESGRQPRPPEGCLSERLDAGSIVEARRAAAAFEVLDIWRQTHPGVFGCFPDGERWDRKGGIGKCADPNDVVVWKAAWLPKDT